jgi:hydroxymethylpyrimidine/phosphomethylpyrimidine kinase
MKHGTMPSACTIAGSDSGGGAGIQADLKTFTALGVWGCTVLTAVTAQNPREVRGVWTLPPAAVTAQLGAVLDEFPVRVCKTGMLGTAAIIRAVADALPEEMPLVLDPVMISTSGHALLDGGAVRDLTGLLIPRASVITPNLMEAEALTGIARIRDAEAMESAGERLLTMGAGAAVVKGGHLKGAAIDVLVTNEGVYRLERERLPYAAHGSGCSFAAAVAAGLARGLSMETAVREAKEFVHESIENGFKSLSGLYSVNPKKP